MPTTKPDWWDAPRWANWLFRDNRGDWFWLERQPLKGQAREGLFVKCAETAPYNTNYPEILESRPRD